MKRKIAIRATVVLIICAILLVGCSKREIVADDLETEQNAETDVEKTPETESNDPPEVETEPDAEPEEEVEPYFGLSEAEVECIVARLREWKLSCSTVDDFDDISCLGFGVTYESGVPKVAYEVMMYGVMLKDGSYGGVVNVSSEVLAARGVDVFERGSLCPLLRQEVG